MLNILLEDSQTDADAMASAYAAEKERLAKGIRQDGYIGSISIEEPVQIIHTKYKKMAVLLLAAVFVSLFLAVIVRDRTDSFFQPGFLMAGLLAIMAAAYLLSYYRPRTMFYQVEFMFYETCIEIMKQAGKERHCYRIMRNSNVKCLACYGKTRRRIIFYGDIISLPSGKDTKEPLSFSVMIQDMEQFKTLRGYIPFAEVYERQDKDA